MSPLLVARCTFGHASVAKVYFYLCISGLGVNLSPHQSTLIILLHLAL